MRIVFAIEYSDYDEYDLQPIFSTRISATAALKRLRKIDPSPRSAGERRFVAEVPIYDSIDEWLASGYAPAPISTWKGD